MEILSFVFVLSPFSGFDFEPVLYKILGFLCFKSTTFKVASVFNAFANKQSFFFYGCLTFFNYLIFVRLLCRWLLFTIESQSFLIISGNDILHMWWKKYLCQSLCQVKVILPFLCCVPCSPDYVLEYGRYDPFH